MIGKTQIFLRDLQFGHDLRFGHRTEKRVERFARLEINRTVFDLQKYVQRKTPS